MYKFYILEMEDISDLHPCGREMEDFVEEEMGEEWLEGGMVCPVVECPSWEHFFQHIGSYWSHSTDFTGSM